MVRVEDIKKALLGSLTQQVFMNVGIGEDNCAHCANLPHLESPHWDFERHLQPLGISVFMLERIQQIRIDETLIGELSSVDATDTSELAWLALEPAEKPEKYETYILLQNASY